MKDEKTGSGSRKRQPRRCPRRCRQDFGDYQAGFSWLARFSSWGMVAFLADDMGLGKQQIVVLHARKRDLADSLLEGTDLAG